MHRKNLALLSALLALARPALGAEVGDTVEEAQLPTLAGGKAPLVGGAKANVFVFAKPGQEHSRTTLVALARMEKQFAGKPVRFAAVVSDRFSPEEVGAFVRTTGFASPVLIDAGEALYSKLRIRLHPVVGVVDKRRKLLSLLPFTKLDYEPSVRAEIQFALGEITEEQLKRIRTPPPATQGGAANVAQRYLKMGERLFSVKDYPKALDSASKSLAHDPNLAAAHSLIGAIRAATGHCSEALHDFDAALALDPKDARALEGKPGCAGR